MVWPAVAVVPAESSAEAAVTALRFYADRARVAVWQSAGPQIVWYLFTVGEIRSRLEDAAPTAAVASVLDLRHAPTARTWPLAAGTADPTQLPALVLEGDQVVGVAEAPAERAVAAAEEAEEEGEEGPEWEGRDAIGFRTRGTAAAVKQPFEIVRVFYGTDRQPIGDAAFDPYYGGERGSGLTLGYADVSIPARRKKGTLQRPSWWRLEFRQDPARHVMVARVQPLSRDEFLEDIRPRLAGSGRKDALLFVHGYNVTFPDAVRRTAQLAHDLRSNTDAEFPGLPLLYSWPSQGRFLQYLTDETNVGWTLPRFEAFLRIALTEIGAERVHVIAHSMGNRALIECLKTLNTATLPAGAARLQQVIFAAPDFDADSFRQLAQTLSLRAGRCTLYASSGDQALRASRELRSDLARAGESGDGMVVVDGIDTIDATSVDTSLLGHGYFGERTVLGDIFYLLKDGKSPDDRFGLTRRLRSDRPYWEFVP